MVLFLFFKMISGKFLGSGENANFLNLISYTRIFGISGEIFVNIEVCGILAYLRSAGKFLWILKYSPFQGL